MLIQDRTAFKKQDKGSQAKLYTMHLTLNKTTDKYNLYFYFNEMLSVSSLI